MERFVLRVLVIVLLGTTLGFWARGHSTVITGLPPQPKHVDVAKSGDAPSGETGATGATGAKVATGATGSTAPTVAVAPPPAATGPATPAAKPAAPGANLDDYFIDLTTAKKLWDTKKYGSGNDEKDVIFIDAREYVEYTEGHIPGAMSCPKRRFDGAVPKYVRNYLPGNAVVVYCHGVDCTDSEAVVKRLIALNLNIGPFFIIKDGIPGWEKAGYPINKGDNEGFVN